MTLYGVFLDDERNPEDVTWISYPKDIQWTVVRTPTEFFEAVDNGKVDIVSFDHDIQAFTDEGEVTGYDILKSYLSTMEDLCDPPLFRFHTQNVVGKQNMIAFYENWKIAFIQQLTGEDE